MFNIWYNFDVNSAVCELKAGKFTATEFADKLIVQQYTPINKTAEEIVMQYAKMTENRALVVSDYAKQIRAELKVCRQLSQDAEDIHSKIYYDVLKKMDDKKPVKYSGVSNRLLSIIDMYNASIDKKNKLQKKFDKAEKDLLNTVTEYKNIIPLLIAMHEIFVRYRNFRVYSRALFFSHTIDAVEAYIPMISIKSSEISPNVNWYFVKLSIDRHVKSCTAPTRVGIEIFKYDQLIKMPSKHILTPYEINNRLKKVNPFPGDRFIAVKKITPDASSINGYIVSVLRMLVEIGFEF